MQEAMGKVLCKCEVIPTMPKRGAGQLRWRDGAGQWGGRGPQLMGSQAGQQSGLGVQ